MKLGTIIRKGKRLTSFVKGSFLQAIATLEKRCEFSFIGGRTNIVLVPGAFCTSSVMNRLGKLLKKNGI
ncbi:MAG: hypothetical protein N2746_00695 [Deltaproteobacteria bacterium]|nr:hypothetical protein [Deltaproteobacteria bacterium]